MKEVEIKFLDINKSIVIKKLKSLGAKKVFEGKIKSEHFDFKDNSLKAKQMLLRLRTKGDKVEFTLKKDNTTKNAKISEETEVTTSDYALTKKILESLGLRQIRSSMEKHRVSYELKGFHYEIDEFNGYPAFLEIETDSVGKLKKAAELIGLDTKAAVNWTARQVLEHYQNKQRR